MGICSLQGAGPARSASLAQPFLSRGFRPILRDLSQPNGPVRQKLLLDQGRCQRTSTNSPRCGRRWSRSCAAVPCRLSACPVPIRPLTTPWRSTWRPHWTARQRPIPIQADRCFIVSTVLSTRHAVRDLLALDIDGMTLLPADDSRYGFDNIGEVLTVSPLLMERYLAAAGKISRLAVGDPDVLPVFETYNVPKYYVQEDRMNEDLPLGSPWRNRRSSSLSARRRVHHPSSSGQKLQGLHPRHWRAPPSGRPSGWRQSQTIHHRWGKSMAGQRESFHPPLWETQNRRSTSARPTRSWRFAFRPPRAHAWSEWLSSRKPLFLKVRVFRE